GSESSVPTTASALRGLQWIDLPRLRGRGTAKRWRGRPSVRAAVAAHPPSQGGLLSGLGDVGERILGIAQIGIDRQRLRIVSLCAFDIAGRALGFGETVP